METIDDEISLWDLVDRFVKKPKEPQEEYRYPPRLRILENKLNSYYSQHDDLIKEREKALKEIKKLGNQLSFEQVNLENIDKHIRELELKVRLTSKEWLKEREHL